MRTSEQFAIKQGGGRKNYFSLTRILNSGVGDLQGEIIVIEYACYSKNGTIDKINLILL